MIAYIQQIAREIAGILVFPWDLRSLASRLAVLVEELDRLDPRDFLPAFQNEFVNTRRIFRRTTETKPNDWMSFSALARGVAKDTRRMGWGGLADILEIPRQECQSW